MKYLLLPLLLIFLSSNKTSAQKLRSTDSLLHNYLNHDEPVLPTKEVTNHIGSEVYIYDIIYRYKKVNNTHKILYVGGNYQNQLITVFIKGKQPNNHVIFEKGEKWHFSGRVFIYHGKPAITITNTSQLGTRIQI